MIVNVRLDLDEQTLVAITRQRHREIDEATTSRIGRRGRTKPAKRAEVVALVERLVRRYAAGELRTVKADTPPDTTPPTDERPTMVRSSATSFVTHEELRRRVRSYGAEPSEFGDNPGRMLSYLSKREEGYEPGKAPR